MTRVLIAGSGVAAVEAALALDALAGDRVELELLAPAAELHERPWSVLTPFGAEAAPRIDLGGLVHELGMRWHRDSLEAVEADTHTVFTRGGERLHYDLFVLATGAKSRAVIPGAVTFRGPLSAGAVEGALEQAAGNPELRLVFTAPAGATWPLPLYELALMSSAFLRERGSSEPDITIATPEHGPLALLGVSPAEAVSDALADGNIRIVTEAVPEAVIDGALRLRGGGMVDGDVVIALPELVGPRVAGLPRDDEGFVPVDLNGRVHEREDVFAAGDATNFAIKHGGLATQQADAAAETIAAQLGAIVTARPFYPVVRAMLLAGDAPLYIRSDLNARSAVVSREPLWSPLDKIAGRYLSPYLVVAEATGATLVDREITPRQER
jgi:sulfide:quinone oxidoreductase